MKYMLIWMTVCLLAGTAGAYQWEVFNRPRPADPVNHFPNSVSINSRRAPDGKLWVLIKYTDTTAHWLIEAESGNGVDPISMNWLESGFDWRFGADGSLHVIWSSGDFFSNDNPYYGILPQEVALWYRWRSPEGVWSSHVKLHGNPLIITDEGNTMPHYYSAALAVDPSGEATVVWSAPHLEGFRIMRRVGTTWVTDPGILPLLNTQHVDAVPQQMVATRNGALHLFYSRPVTEGWPRSQRMARRLNGVWKDEVIVAEGDANITSADVTPCRAYPYATNGEFGPAQQQIVFRPTDLADTDGDGYSAVVEAALGGVDTNAALHPKPFIRLEPAGASKRARVGFVGPQAAEYEVILTNHIFKKTPLPLNPGYGVHIVAEWSDDLKTWYDSAWSSDATYETISRGSFPNFVFEKEVRFDALHSLSNTPLKRFYRFVCWRDE